jgi:hypothetical protein
VLYADFIGLTTIFSKSIKDMIDLGAFDFSKSEMDVEIEKYKTLYGDKAKEKIKEAWGEFYEEYAELYALDEVLAGIYHGEGDDLTGLARSYLSKLIEKSDEHPELEGCVAVDAELAELLQMLMDKYTFRGVEHSWTKVCYYYDYMGR